MGDLEYKRYTGQWIGLTESRQLAGVGPTAEEARRASQANRVKERIQVYWVSDEPPHILLPDWPIQQVRDLVYPEQLWVVGGAVRDLIASRTPHDWDFLVERNALQIARTVADRLGGAYFPLDEVRETGRVLLRAKPPTPATILDFAVPRGDGSIESDLAARDFTINAMALTPTGHLIDPQDGLGDLCRGVLRATSDLVFEQDPARLLRAVRIAYTHSYSIAATTESALREQAELIATVAPERIRAEIQAMVADPTADKSLLALAQYGLLRHILPEAGEIELATEAGGSSPGSRVSEVAGTLAALAYIYESLRIPSKTPGRHGARGLQVVSVVRKYQPELLSYLQHSISTEMTREDLVKWAALFVSHTSRPTEAPSGSDAASLKPVGRRLRELRFPGRALRYVYDCVKGYQQLLNSPDTEVDARRAHQYYRSCGDAGLGAVLLALAHGILESAAPESRERWQGTVVQAGRLMNAYFRHFDRIVDPKPLLTGEDVLALGVPESALLGEVLRQLKEEQAAGAIASRDEAEAWVIERVPKVVKNSASI